MGLNGRPPLEATEFIEDKVNEVLGLRRIRGSAVTDQGNGAGQPTCRHPIGNVSVQNDGEVVTFIVCTKCGAKLFDSGPQEQAPKEEPAKMRSCPLCPHPIHSAEACSVIGCKCQSDLCQHGYSRPHLYARRSPFGGWQWDNELPMPGSRERRVNCPGPSKVVSE